MIGPKTETQFAFSQFEENELEIQILGVLNENPKGLTQNEIYINLKAKGIDIYPGLAALTQMLTTGQISKSLAGQKYFPI